MISHISCLLEAFRPCFTRQAAYHWFVTVMMGFIVRIDHCGVAFLCALARDPGITGKRSVFWPAGVKKISCIPLCAELHEGVEALRSFQQKVPPLVDGQPKVSITSLIEAMVAELVPELGRKCILVLYAYFAVGPVFAILKTVRDATGSKSR